MRSPPAAVLALLALLVVSSMGAVAAAPATGVDHPSDRAALADGQSPLEPADPRQAIRINVSADGDARWTIESRYHLETEEDVERFEEYADAVSGGERDIALEGGYDVTVFETARAQAESATDREMSIDDDGWADPRIEATDDDHEVGVIAYGFEWSNFAAVDGNRLHLGDVFWADGETWLPTLADDQRLVIEPPANYGFEDPPIGTQNGALVWDGPYVFAEGELEVTFLEGAMGNGTGNGAGADGLFPAPTILSALGLLVLLALVGGGGYLLATRYPPSELFGTDDETRTELEYEEGAADPAGSADPGSDLEEPREDSDGVDEPDLEAPEEEIDPELLSDEERVHRLLAENGGRMKQARIVEETGWSNAKVSQLLSAMDDDGEIDKLRIGRENLITLPEVDPTEVD